MAKDKQSKNRSIREKLPYRDCVGIAVFNDKGQVWAGQRLLSENDENEGAVKLWQLPQGGIDKGEDPLGAAKRELYEETGITSVEVLAEIPEWLNYELPDAVLGRALKGKYRGQRQKWFAFRFIGNEAEIAINPPPEGQEAEFDAWDWVELESLPEMVVDFKRDVYQALVRHFKSLSFKNQQESSNPK